MTSGNSLLLKYIASFVAAVGVPLLGYVVVGVWLASSEHQAALLDLQRLNARIAGYRIGQFVRDVEGQLRWTTHLGWDGEPIAQHRVDALRLLRQAPAVSDLTLLDQGGFERVFVSRTGIDRFSTMTDRSDDPAFLGARRFGTYFGPVYLRRDSEPFMTVAISGAQLDTGVAIAEVNLTHARDVVSDVRIGKNGQAYVIDGGGRLIAHADMSVVLRKTDLSHLHSLIRQQSGQQLHFVTGIGGGKVALAYASVPPLDWHVIVELPEAEAREPLYRALWNSAAVALASILVALLLAVLFSQRMIAPIRELAVGAKLIGSGRLDHRIKMRGGDELFALGEHFNAMAARLERSYATMEREVAERTNELSEANRAKSRFLAAASHDLRQPLHALNLLVGQLDQPATNAQRHILTSRIGEAVASINSLFDDLLDISRLEAGVVRTDVSVIPLHEVVERVVAAALPDAQEKGLSLRIHIGDVWVTSDAVLLQRILSNLVGNAVRYTERGGVLLGCRIRGEHVSVEVWDTGIGIPRERHKDIFSEFYQIADPQIARRGEGLGLGLSIVARLTKLLDHDVSVCSLPGRGSRFAIRVRLGQPNNSTSPGFHEAESAPPVNSLEGLRLLLIDNDANILHGAKSLLIHWGCQVVTARSRTEAFQNLKDEAPSLVIADFRLDNGDDGVSAIHAIRERFGPVPALIVTGEISVSTRQRASAAGLHMLEKPVPPLRLRTALTRLARGQRRPEASSPTE